MLPRHAPNQWQTQPALTQKPSLFAIEPTVFSLTRYSHFLPGFIPVPDYQSPMVGDSPEEWLELYRGALMELDRVKLPQRIDAASTAIQQRISQLLVSKDGHQEYSALEDALRNLRSLRRQTE